MHHSRVEHEVKRRSTSDDLARGDPSRIHLQDIFLILNGDLKMPCQDANWQFSGGQYSISGQAKNWGNQVTAGTLSFRVQDQ